MIKEGEYKGRPTISLMRTPEDKYPFTFGFGKAKLITEHVDEIEEFVQKHSGEESNE